MKHRRAQPAAAVMAMVIGLAGAGSAWADAVRLYATAEATGPAVTLGQIASLDGSQAEALAELEVGRFDEDEPVLKVRHEQVRTLMREQGVHPGKVTLSGSATTRVHRQADRSQPVRERPRTAAMANVEHEVDLERSMTLHGKVARLLASMNDAELDELRIRFSERDQQRLQRTTAGKRFELEPMARRGLGRVPVRVRQYEGARMVEDFSVAAEVERRVTAVVAAGTISRGQAFAQSDVELEQVYLSSDRGKPLDDPALLEGQKADRLLREGTVIYPEHVRSPRLIRRGELVTVRAISGGVVVRTVARAREDGAEGEVVELRNEDTRQTFRAQVTGRREAALMLDEGSDTPGLSDEQLDVVVQSGDAR